MLKRGLTIVAAVCGMVVAGGKGYAQSERRKEKPAAAEAAAGLPAFTAQEQQLSESYFLEGMKFFVLEEYGKALDRFQRAYAISPTNAAVNYKLAETSLLLGSVRGALPFAKAALELEPKNQYYHLLLAQIYTNQQQYEEAIKVYARLTTELPNTEQYLFNLTDLYLAKNRLDDALRTLGQIEEKYGLIEEISFKKQQIYLKQNNLEKALAEGRNLIEANPDEVKYLLAQAEMLAANKRVAEAIQMAEKALKVAPDNAYGRLMLADLLQQQGKHAEADVQLELAFGNSSLDIDSKVKILVDYIRRLPDAKVATQAIKLAELTTKAHPQEAKAFAVAGDIYVNSDKKLQARDNYLKAVKLDPGHFKIWQQIVLLDGEMNHTDSLIVHSERALEFFPNQPMFWYYNGVAHLLNKNYSKGAKSLEYGRRMAGNNVELQLQFNLQLGDAYHSLEQYDLSDQAYDRVLAIDPNNPHALNNYSYFLSLRGHNLAKAKIMAGVLVAQFPDNATYLDTYAWVLYKLKDYQEAKRLLEKAVALSSDATIIEHYGDVLYQLGSREAALKQWVRANQVGGASEAISKKIKDKKLYE
ncbi:tetratricopeptide repeat protein [Rufibacter quisquiliarum]|uniref:Tetratricopeptide (TPR) repeat protein n=1 Tax=Rufibacter quisquiliarum TaxID=1549639 RepID=A0A839GFN0_9BACT|nr:tetratricopeptide repeat protein [Rufibacter quisquiliarum]MBA9077702.1 tetratricopeptide (TPR) repeat protein [Rufibacter quisquiliarum]